MMWRWLLVSSPALATEVSLCIWKSLCLGRRRVNVIGVEFRIMKIAQLFAAKIRSEDTPYIVSVESATGQVGPHFIEHLATELKGEYQRDPDNIGLMDDFSVLKGQWCDPGRVHPLIREFYEHTSRFVIVVRPKWHWLFLPLFWLFRKVFAELVGQFNLPIDDAEAGR